MAVRVRVQIETAAKKGRPHSVETVAVANSGYESDAPGALVPIALAARLGLWPPPPGAHIERFESPVATSNLTSVPRGIRVSLTQGPKGAITADAVLTEHETEVVMNDALVEALQIELVRVHRGVYRVGPRGPLRRSARPRYWQR